MLFEGFLPHMYLCQEDVCNTARAVLTVQTSILNRVTNTSVATFAFDILKIFTTKLVAEFKLTSHE